MKRGIATTIILSLFLLSCSNIMQTQKSYLRNVAEKVKTGYIGIEEQPAIDEIKLSDEHKKIAILLPLTGNAKTVGEVLLNSAQLALFEINNPKITLMPFDTKGTAFGAIEAMNKAVEEDVDIVLGPLFSESVQAVAPIALQNHIEVLSFSNNETLIDQGVFLMGFSPEQQIERIVSYAMDQGYTSFAALVPNNHYGETVSKVLKETVHRKDGKVIKTEFYFENNYPGLEKNVKRILDSYAIADRVYEQYEEMGKDLSKEKEFIVQEEDKIYPEVILIPESGKTLETIAALIQQHKSPDRNYKLLGSGQWDNVETASNENLTGGWFVAPEPKYYYEFERKYYETYGTFPIRIASIPYDAVMMLNHLAKKDKGFDKESITYYKGFVGIDGIFRFLPNGLVERRFSILEVEYGAFKVLDEPLYRFMDY